MKIILSQEEIQDVLENHVNSQLTLAPGQSVTVELVSGEDGFIAELDIRAKTSGTSKPKAATRTAAKSTPRKLEAVKDEPEEEAPEQEQADPPKAEASDEAEPETTEDTPTTDENTSSEPEEVKEVVVEVRKASGKGSIFNFQNKA